MLKSYLRLGLLQEFTRDCNKELVYYNQCYNYIQQYLAYLRANFDIWEIRTFADFVLFKLLQLMFLAGQIKEGVALFEEHYAIFRLPYKHLAPAFMHSVHLQGGV